MSEALRWADDSSSKRWARNANNGDRLRTGNDPLEGGAGQDIYIFNKGDGTDTVVDTKSENNIFRFSEGLKSSDIKLRLGSLLLDMGNCDAIHIENFNQHEAYNSVAIDSFQFADGSTLSSSQLLARGFYIDGTAQGDMLVGTNITDRMRGLGGNDVLIGDGEDDALYGGAGDDELQGDALGTELAGEYHGNDYQDGDDQLDGGGGNDKLLGGAGSDNLIGGRGNDTLRGGRASLIVAMKIIAACARPIKAGGLFHSTKSGSKLLAAQTAFGDLGCRVKLQQTGGLQTQGLGQAADIDQGDVALARSMIPRIKSNNHCFDAIEQQTASIVPIERYCHE